MTTPASGPLFIWLGADRPAKQQRLAAVRSQQRIHLLDDHRLDAAHLSPDDLAALARQQPAASPLRLLVIDDGHRLSAPGVQALLDVASGGAPTTWIIVLVDVELEARHPLRAALPQAGVERFEGEGGREAAAGGFALVDAIAQRDPAAALIAVQEQLAKGKDPLELIGLVAWQVQRWLTVKELLAASAGPERITAVAGLQPWQLDRVKAQVRQRPVEELRRQLNACWRVDVDAKRGRTLPKPALEQLVAGLCLPGSG